MRKPIRAVAIVIRNDEILLMHRIKFGQEFYVFPGGGVEDNETVEVAVIREIREETTLEIKIEKLLYHHHYIKNSDQYFYLCSYISGTPQLGESEEKEEMKVSSDNLYTPMWIKISEINKLLLYPLEIRDWLLEDYAKGFKTPFREASMEVKDLRQMI